MLCTAIGGCEKKCTQLNTCGVGLASYNANRIIGYPRDNVDTQIIIHFKPNGLFDVALDSSIFTLTPPEDSWFPPNLSDTQEIGIYFNGSARNTQRINDVQLILPGIRTYRFTDVMVEGDYEQVDEFKCQSGSFGCRRNVVSLKIDGVYKDLSGSDARIELHK